MLVEKKISSKINYDVLRELSDDNSTQDSKEDTNTVPSVETTPPIQSSLCRKRTFSLLDSDNSTVASRRPSFSSCNSSAPSRYSFVLFYDRLS